MLRDISSLCQEARENTAAPYAYTMVTHHIEDLDSVPDL